MRLTSGSAIIRKKRSSESIPHCEVAMHPDKNQPTTKPSNGEVSLGPAVGQPSPAAKTASSIPTSRVAPLPNPPPPRPQTTVVPPATQSATANQRPGADPPPQLKNPPRADQDQQLDGAGNKTTAAEGSSPKHTRPCFESASWDSLPGELQRAYDAIVSPCNEQLVMGERFALSKATGMTYTFETRCVILLQHQVAEADMSGKDPQKLEQLLDRYSRAAMRQHRAAALLLRIKALQLRQPSRGPLRPRPEDHR
jgi:hypothetical protein